MIEFKLPSLGADMDEPRPPQPGAAATVAGRRRVSPAARKHAEELGVDTDTVAGSGPEGAVTLEDVARAAAGAGAAAGLPAMWERRPRRDRSVAAEIRGEGTASTGAAL